jgi:uroporphyrinogen-III synthase
MRIWVTRAEPEAQATAERLRELGHEPFVAPVLEIRPLAAEIALDGVAAIAFTSRNGVRCFPAIDAARTLPVFAVGDATAAAAREAGFTDVRSAEGDGAALAALIVAGLDPVGGAVLVARARQPAFDLEGALAAAGFEARTAIVYRSVAILPKAEVLAAMRASPPLDAMLVHSPRAARQAAKIIGGQRGRRALMAYAISAAAAGPLEGLELRGIDVAPFPSEAALLKLLTDPRESP